ncbi:MAG: ferrous iron transport protein A [Pirellulaceae bacterium]
MHSTIAQALLPLHLLQRGQVAEIGELIGKTEQIHRLHELGLHVGRRVEMVQPGSPCILRLDGQRLCFRHSDALAVFVRCAG